MRGWGSPVTPLCCEVCLGHFPDLGCDLPPTEGADECAPCQEGNHL